MLCDLPFAYQCCENNRQGTIMYGTQNSTNFHSSEIIHYYISGVVILALLKNNMRYRSGVWELQSMKNKANACV